VTLGELVVGIGSIVGGVRVLHAAHARDRQRPPRQPPPPNGRLRSNLYNVNTLDARVRRITDMVRASIRKPEVRELAAAIVAQKCGGDWCIREKDWPGESRALFDYVRHNVRYTGDIRGIDTFQSAIRTLLWAAGDCDDMAILLAALLLSIGHLPELVVIRTTNSRDWNHIYVRDLLPPRHPTRRMSLDASMDKPAGWEVPERLVADRRVYPLH